MGFSIELLNTIRANASETYQEYVPIANANNFSDIGNALKTWSLVRNEYQDSLINRIGKTMIESKLFKNKLSKFKKGKASPKDVEEIFVEMASRLKLSTSLGTEGTVDAYSESVSNFGDVQQKMRGVDLAMGSPGLYGNRSTNTNLGQTSGGMIALPGNSVGSIALANFGQPDTKVIYHKRNRQDIYPITIGDLDFQRAFISEATHDNFVTELINSVYSGAEYDEWILMKDMIGSYSGYADYIVPEYDAAGTAPNNSMERFLASVKKANLDISFASTAFNQMGVKTWTDPKDQVLLIHKDVVAETDVTTLAKAFQLNKMDVPVDNIMIMDDFGKKTEVTVEGVKYTTYGVLVDKDIFRIWDTLFHFEPQRNALGLYTNYFLHVHQIMSMSRFKNAVRFLAPITEE